MAPGRGEMTRYYRKDMGTEVRAVRWTGLADELQQVQDLGFDLQAAEGQRTGKPLEVYYPDDGQHSVWLPLGIWAVHDPNDRKSLFHDPFILTDEEFQARYEIASGLEPDWFAELRRVAAAKKSMEGSLVSHEGSYEISRPMDGTTAMLISSRIGDIVGPNTDDVIQILADYYRAKEAPRV